VDWPIPPAADAKRVPGWAVVAAEAELLAIPLPHFLRWAGTPAGRWWLTRLRLKWAITAAAEAAEAQFRQEQAEDAAWHARGWRGGHTEPLGTAREA